MEDSNYNIGLTNAIQHALYSYDENLVIEPIVNRATKYIDKIELKLHLKDDHHHFASIFVEISYGGRWGSTNAGITIYGKMTLPETLNFNIGNYGFERHMIKYEKLNPIVTVTRMSTISRSHVKPVMSEKSTAEIKFEIYEKTISDKFADGFSTISPYSFEQYAEIGKSVIPCVNAFRDILNQVKLDDLHLEKPRPLGSM